MAKPDLKSLFSFLEPGEQEPKAKIPYRAPAEMPEYEISKGLKPGEVQEVKPTEKSKTPNVDTTALVKKIGSKPKVIEEKHDIKGAINIPFGPDPTTPPPAPPVAEEPLPFEGMGQEGVPSEPPPSIEELVKKQTEGLGHVEGKQVRNAVIMKDQQDTTGREFASDSSVWDEIWPALVPVAVNALMGHGDYEATFNIASDTIDKIQKEKKDWYKLTGAGKKGAGTDQIALERERQKGRKEIQSMRGQQGQKALGAKAIYAEHLAGTKGDIAEKNIYTKGGLTTLENLGKDRRALERMYGQQEEITGRKGQDFITVEHPTTKQPVSISRKELLAIPFDQRPKVIQQTRGGSTGLITKSYVKDNKNITEFIDRQTGQTVRKTEHDVGDSSPYLPGTTKKQTAGLDPVVKDFRKESTEAIENQKDLMKAINMIRSENVYENTQAIFTMIKKIEGRMTEEDAKRYTAPLDYWGQLMNEARKKGKGKYDENLIQGMQNAALRSLNGIRDSYKNLPTRYLKYAQNITQNIDIPDKDKHLAKIFETPYMEDKEYQEAMKKK